jgi:4-carboxymuconolactone decarboxylase
MGKDAYRKGMKTRRNVLGDEWVDAAERNKTSFNEDFQRLITIYAWDEVWNRPHFNHKTRRLLTLAMTAALGRWEEFRIHVRSGLASKDLSEDDIKELLLQSAIYCGVPTANHAIKEARIEMDALAKRTKAARRRPS